MYFCGVVSNSQRNRGVRHGADVIVYQRADGALQAAAAKRLAARGIPDQRLHSAGGPCGAGSRLAVPAVRPSRRSTVAASSSVQSSQGDGCQTPATDAHPVHGVDDGQPAGDAHTFSPLQQRCRGGRGVESDAGSRWPHPRTGWRTRSRRLQLVPAGLGVLGRSKAGRPLDQPVQGCPALSPPLPTKPSNMVRAASAIHGLLSPAAARLSRLRDALRQCDSEG